LSTFNNIFHKESCYHRREAWVKAVEVDVEAAAGEEAAGAVEAVEGKNIFHFY